MATFVQPLPATFAPAHPVAAWLGHLAQMDFTPRNSPLPQTDQDREIEAFVAHIRRYELQHVPFWQRVRGRSQATELANASRALSGERRPGDYSDAIRRTEAFASLVGLVWHASQKQSELDGANSRHGLMVALASCIEDDGHRVCGVGQKQRILGALQAATITPAQLLTELAAEFARQGDDPSEAQIAHFSRRAHLQGQERLGHGSPAMVDFLRQLQDYLRMTYGGT